MANPNDMPGVAGGNTPVRLTALPPAWAAFVRYCAELKYGEIERLSIQDGLPVLAEMTKKKIKFTNG
jgi:hypothetical protein